MEALGSYDTEARVGVAKNKNGIGLGVDHDLIALGYDVAHSFAQVLSYCFHINVWCIELEVVEEDSIEVVVIVLTGVGQKGVEIFTAFADDGCKTDNLWTGSYDNEELEATVVLELGV
jgi:hypothetical protein